MVTGDFLADVSMQLGWLAWQSTSPEDTGWPIFGPMMLSLLIIGKLRAFEVQVVSNLKSKMQDVCV